MSESYDIAIIGAGIAGSTTAYVAASRGLRTLLIDAGDGRTSTTWASGGMLAPLAELLTGGLLELGLRCRDGYKTFIDSIETESGLETGYGTGVLVPLQPDRKRAASAAYFQAHLRGHRLMPDIVDLNVDSRLQAGIGLKDVGQAAWIAKDAVVDPRLLLLATQTAAVKTGATFLPNSTVTGVSAEGIVYLANSGELRAKTIVIAAGHHAPQIAGVAWPNFGKITGDRGIMVRVSNVPIPKCVIYDHFTDGVTYLIPEANGIRIGSNTNPEGSSPHWTQNEVDELLVRAHRVWPLLDGQVTEVSVGFRPVGPNVTGEPYVAPLDGSGHIWGLLGMHRNGILFAPKLAEYLIDSICRSG